MENTFSKIEQLLRDDATLREKYEEILKHLLETEEAGMPEEAVAKAVKSVLDIDILPSDLARARAEKEELDPEELEIASGGENREDYDRCNKDYACHIVFKHPDDPRHGEACWWDWTCFGVYNCVKGPN